MNESDRKAEHREVMGISLKLMNLKVKLENENIEDIDIIEDAIDKLMELLKEKHERSDRY